MANGPISVFFGGMGKGGTVKVHRDVHATSLSSVISRRRVPSFNAVSIACAEAEDWGV